MSFIQYLKDVQNEVKHVSWPTQKQTVIFTVIVMIISLLTAFYLGAFDFLLTKLLEIFLG